MSKITVVGSFFMDNVAKMDRFPNAGETLIGKNLSLFPGGKGNNQCVAAARLGGDVEMIGMLGKDQNGETFRKILKEDTVIITPDSSRELACDLTKDRERVKIVEPANEYELPGVKFSTTYAFNKEVLYHTKQEKWVGYIIELDGVKYYIAGDTLYNEEIFDDIPNDIYALFLPINGVGNNMNMTDASRFAKQINAKKVVPIHIGMFDEITADKFECENKVIPNIYREVIL